MKLTWEDFEKYASIVTNLKYSIDYFDAQKNDIKEQNRRVAFAANEYRNLLNDVKFVEFTELVRIC